ncbi:30S ribosomal protein S8, partial [Staphylococcus saprophyticus]|uniref:30S ribosomal protein S8 n=1 Tax=Staphylococcus saprophyticus TaxID=29385 RepID=UPI0011A13730
QILKSQPFIKNVEYLQHHKQRLIPLFLKYPQNNQPLITPLKPISKPPLPLYPKPNQLPKLLNPLPIPLLSTSQPLLTHKQPTKRNTPPEILGYIC